MAKRETYVKLWAPDGTPVEVLDTAEHESDIGRVEVLKGRGYTTSKPRNPKGSTNTGDTPDMAQMRAELDQLRAENEALKAADGGTTPEFAPPQTGTTSTKK